MELTVEEYEEIPQFATLVQAMAKEAGINLKTKLVTVSYYYGSGKNQPWLEVPMGITDWTFRGIPAQYYLPAFTSKRRVELVALQEPDLRQAGREFDEHVDEASRRDIAKQAAELLTRRDAGDHPLHHQREPRRCATTSWASRPTRPSTSTLPRRIWLRLADSRSRLPEAVAPSHKRDGKAADGEALMLRLIVRRLLLDRADTALVSVLIFAMEEVVPGDIGRVILGPYASSEQVATLNHQLGADKPARAALRRLARRLRHAAVGASRPSCSSRCSRSPCTRLWASAQLRLSRSGDHRPPLDIAGGDRGPAP